MAALLVCFSQEAGLLTLSLCNSVFPKNVLSPTLAVARVPVTLSVATEKGFTAPGSVADSHCIPFLALAVIETKETSLTAGNHLASAKLYIFFQ